MNPIPPSSTLSRRDGINLARLGRIRPAYTVNRQSSGIHDFFGNLPSASKTVNANTDDMDTDTSSETRSTATLIAITRTVSSKFREQYPTLKMHARRARRSLSMFIQSCSPIWYVPSAPLHPQSPYISSPQTTPEHNFANPKRARFTPSSTLALLALALRLLPLSGVAHFPALPTLSTAFYLAASALYLPVSALFLLRLALYPRETHRATVHERDSSGLELGYLASWPTGWVLLVSFGGFAVSEGSVGSGTAVERGLIMAVYVCWWFGAVGAAVVVMFVLGCLLSTRTRGASRTGGGRFAPLVGLLVCMRTVGTVAFVGGLLVWLQKPRDEGEGGGEGIFSPAMAAPVVVFSLCATGAAWFLANLIYGVLMHELVLIMGWPPPEHTATVFAMVGPLGQGASALLVLAAAARRLDGFVFLGGGLGTSRTVTGLADMMPLETMCVLLALLIGGMAVVWLLLGIVTIFYRLYRGELAWNPSWNSIVSPVATLAILSVMLAMALDSAFFRIVACVIIIACVLMVVVNVGFTTRLAVTARRKKDLTATGSIGEP